jgi:hypothetical protein
MGGAGPWRLLGVLRADRAAAAEEIDGIEVTSSGPVAAALVPHDEGAGVRAGMSQHAGMAERVHARTAFLPARYGVLVRDPGDVVSALLDPNRDAFEALLADVDGRDEVRVRVYQVEQAAIEELAEADPGIVALREAMLDLGEEAPAGLRLELGERVARALAALAEADAALVLESLRPLAVAVRGEGPASGSLVLDASFLVDRAKAAAFDQAVGSVVERLGARARVRAVGPLPPYRFAAPALPGEEAA